MAFTTTFGHYQDIGGLRAGSISPHATEIYHEGVLVPPVRIVREGQLNEEAYRIFLRNSRLPDLVEGDTRAMMASCRLAETRLAELFARYGAPTVLAAFDACIAQTAPAGARALPRPGAARASGRFHDFLDSDGGAEARPYRDRAGRWSARGRPRAPRRLALGRPGARADQLHDQPRAAPHRASGAICSRSTPTSTSTRGCSHNLDEWIAREGSILKPRFPAPLGMRANTRFRVMSCIFGALAQANGGRVPAGSPVYVLYYFRAWDEARQRPILCIEGLGVGLGARPFADGVDVIYYIAQENYPVEYVERDFPLRVERYAVRPDSGGPGFHRGGTGVVRDVRVLCERAELATRMENTVVAPYGVAGGGAGRTGRIMLNPGTPGGARAARRWATASSSSAAICCASRPAAAAAGAIRSPASPSACARTWRAASSPRAARSRTTGSCSTPPRSRWTRPPPTRRARRRARDLPLIDRGPGFAEAEARWRAARANL